MAENVSNAGYLFSVALYCIVTGDFSDGKRIKTVLEDWQDELTERKPLFNSNGIVYNKFWFL